jgi:hypothetical protein
VRKSRKNYELLFIFKLENIATCCCNWGCFKVDLSVYRSYFHELYVQQVRLRNEEVVFPIES